MAHRSKQEVTKRTCRTCGFSYYARKGERIQCPMFARHFKEEEK